MSALEEIEAAIAALTASKHQLVACPEFNQGAVRHIARNVDISCEHDEAGICFWDRYETAPAIDMLARTIEAQLAILQQALRYETSSIGTGSAEESHRTALTLARAINGATK